MISIGRTSIGARVMPKITLPKLYRAFARAALISMPFLAAACNGSKETHFALCLPEQVKDASSEEAARHILRQICGERSLTADRIKTVQELAKAQLKLSRHKLIGCPGAEIPIVLVLNQDNKSLGDLLCLPKTIEVKVPGPCPEDTAEPTEEPDAGILDLDKEDAGAKPVPPRQPKTIPTVPGTRTVPVPTSTKTWSPI